jgi:hypothetical protein
VVAASKERESMMMNNKGRISRYPTAHTENNNLPPVLSFSTSRNQIFVFLLLFLIFFLNQVHKRMKSTKYQLKPIKDVIGTNSGAFGKTGARTSEPESSAFLIFLIFFEDAESSIAGELYVQFFESFLEKKNFTSIGVASEKLCPF